MGVGAGESFDGVRAVDAALFDYFGYGTGTTTRTTTSTPDVNDYFNYVDYLFYTPKTPASNPKIPSFPRVHPNPTPIPICLFSKCHIFYNLPYHHVASHFVGCG